MNELLQHIDRIEDQYNENLQKVKEGTWTFQQWYDYCTVTLCDLMRTNDKQQA